MYLIKQREMEELKKKIEELEQRVKNLENAVNQEACRRLTGMYDPILGDDPVREAYLEKQRSL